MQAGKVFLTGERSPAGSLWGNFPRSSTAGVTAGERRFRTFPQLPRLLGVPQGGQCLRQRRTLGSGQASLGRQDETMGNGVPEKAADHAVAVRVCSHDLAAVVDCESGAIVGSREGDINRGEPSAINQETM